MGKKKTSFYKRWWFWLIIGLLALSGIGSTLTDGAPEESPQIADAPSIQAPDTTRNPTGEETDTEKGRYTLPCGMEFSFSDSVRNDVTGKWRISTTSSNIVPADCALEYYETAFSSDDEIHAIWNATLKTTTRISVSGNYLFVDTMEYVDGEEHDAKLLFSGTLLDSKIIDLETGSFVDQNDPNNLAPSIQENADQDLLQAQMPAPTEQTPAADPPASEPQVTEPPAAQPSTPAAPAKPPVAPDTSPVQPQEPSAPSSSSLENNNFNTYDNPDQQQTADAWVLNTNRMKIHYPSCSSVAKISPENYATSNLSESELIAQGYTTCGVCHK